MPEFNPDQFRQNSFDGFGERPMRPYRTSRPQPASDPQPASTPSGWTQPQLPDPPAAPASPARLTPAAQARADISAARAETRTARVATAQANAQAATHRQTAAEARATKAQQRAAQATRTPPRVDPSSVPDLTPPPLPDTPSGPGRRAPINNLAYRSTSMRFGPPPAPPEPAPSTVPPRPTRPARPPAPPSSTSRPGRVTPGMARAGRAAGVGVFVAAKALQSISRPATDPKRSGNPLYKTNQGWMR
ncbi:hypothetical protein ABZ281_00780 [Streptomyces sp. NPDC006265]|uniref:hypothetical protein n=1 Tax=Streptomyces sp. NPDC006265 TaxID=3156740 RepID=UPI0033B350F5